MDAQQLAQRTAAARTREAEYATDDAAAMGTSAGHTHAEQLHREAAVWQRRAGRRARAEVHDEAAAVHKHLSRALLTDDTDDDTETG